MPSRSDNAIPPGTRIADRYVVTDVLGEGGFATIYRGVEEALERPVAIKVLDKLRGDLQRDDATSAAHIKRFEREASIASGLGHPNVVTIFANGTTEDSGLAYIVMELLEGHDLDDELARHGPLSVERTLSLLLPCLDAVGQGHELGVIHKDLKPSNLFLVHPGDPERESIRILDYGVAHIQGDRGARLTSTGMYMGTPQYMAPEYIKAEPISPALDVYQMGLILVEMITGTPVVDLDDPFQCLMAHCDASLTLPFELMATDLGPIIRRALSRYPEDRYPDAHAFRDALSTIDPQRVVDDIWRAREEHPDRVTELNPGASPKPPPPDKDDEAFEFEIAAALESITSLEPLLGAEHAPAEVAAAHLATELAEEIALSGGLDASAPLDPSGEPDPDEEAQLDALDAEIPPEHAPEATPAPPPPEPPAPTTPQAPPHASPSPRAPLWMWAAAAVALGLALAIGWSFKPTPKPTDAPDKRVETPTPPQPEPARVNLEPTATASPGPTKAPERVTADRVDALVHETSALLEERRWDEAITAIDRTLPEIPRERRAGLLAMRAQALKERRFKRHLEEGRAALAEDRHQDALEHFEQIPEDPVLSVYATEVAEERLRERTRHDELQTFKNHLGDAIGLHESGRNHLALIHVRKALELRPNHGTALALLDKIQAALKAEPAPSP